MTRIRLAVIASVTSIELVATVPPATWGKECAPTRTIQETLTQGTVLAIRPPEEVVRSGVRLHLVAVVSVRRENTLFQR